MFLTGYFLGIGTVVAYLLGEAVYEAAQLKKRRDVEGRESSPD